MRPCVLCNDSMAPGSMHILFFFFFVHSDGFVIKEFHFPSSFPKTGREKGKGLGG